MWNTFFKNFEKAENVTPNSGNRRGSPSLSQQRSADYYSHPQSRTGDERGLSFNILQSGLIYSSFTLTSASCLSIALGLFFFFQNRLSHSCSSVQQSLSAVQSVAPRAGVLKKTCWLWNRRGVVLFDAGTFQCEQAYFWLLKKNFFKRWQQSFDPFDWRERKDKQFSWYKLVTFFLRGGSQVAPERKKISALQLPFQMWSRHSLWGKLGVCPGSSGQQPRFTHTWDI